MTKSLFIIRNPDSPLLRYIDIEKENYEAILIQNAVCSEELRKIGKIKILKEDAELHNITENSRLINYNEVLNLIFPSDKIVCV